MYPGRCTALTLEALLCGSTLLTAEAQSALSAHTCRCSSSSAAAMRSCIPSDQHPPALSYNPLSVCSRPQGMVCGL